MAIVRDILMNKDREILSIGPEASALDAALLMNQRKVGSLLVMEDGTVIGIITERDLLRPHDAPPATRAFEATGDPEAFTKLATRFLGPAVTGVQPMHRQSRVH